MGERGLHSGSGIAAIDATEGSLNLDPYAQRLGTASHEAAHGVAAAVLGAPLREVSIEADAEEGSNGHCSIVWPRTAAEARVALVVLLIGVGDYFLPDISSVAEHGDTGAAVRLFREHERLDLVDWQKAWRLSRLIRERYRVEVRVLADALLQRRVLSGEDVAKLLNGTAREGWDPPPAEPEPGLESNPRPYRFDAETARKAACAQWNINRGQPCTCGMHDSPAPAGAAGGSGGAEGHLGFRSTPNSGGVPVHRC